MEVLDTCADNEEMDFNDEDSKAESDGVVTPTPTPTPTPPLIRRGK